MKSSIKFLVFILLTLMNFGLSGQNLISKKLDLLKGNGSTFRSVELFNIANGKIDTKQSLRETVKKFALLNFNKSYASDVIKDKVKEIILGIPHSQDSLIESELFSSTF